jgi:hypothetical protein
MVKKEGRKWVENAPIWVEDWGIWVENDGIISRTAKYSYEIYRRNTFSE